jgi:hypothetical protein
MEIFKSRIGDPMTTKPGKTVSKTFELDSKVSFEVTSNRKWKEYAVVLNVGGELGGLRIDPGVSTGVAEIARIELSRLYGPVLKRWDF